MFQHLREERKIEVRCIVSVSVKERMWCSVSVRKVACELSKEYGFNLEEGMLLLERKGVVERKGVGGRVKRRRGGVPLPWVGLVREGGCKGLEYNNGLFTQCELGGEYEGYCKKCKKYREENNGKCRYGTVEDRKKKDFKGWEGKKVVGYGNVLEKKGISEENAKEYARKVGVEIPEEMFEVIKKKRGRPKKVSVEVVDTDEEKPKKKRGRPKKVSAEINPVDLIANLVAEAEKVEKRGEEEAVDDDTPTDTVTEFTHDGKKYFRSTGTNLLYDIESEEPVGQWDELTGKILKLDLYTEDEE